MSSFDDLLKVAKVLNSPEGCAWDRKQTFKSLQPYVLEEAHEVVDAVDAGDDQKIVEELGDLLYQVVFYAEIAEKEGRFTFDDIAKTLREKLIRRHPHVFTEKKTQNIEEITQKWQEIKQSESMYQDRRSSLDGIPKGIPSLMRAQKIIKMILRTNPDFFSKNKRHLTPLSENVLGQHMIDIVLSAEESGIDAEGALRRSLQNMEESYRSSER